MMGSCTTAVADTYIQSRQSKITTSDHSKTGNYGRLSQRKEEKNGIGVSWSFPFRMRTHPHARSPRSKPRQEARPFSHIAHNPPPSLLLYSYSQLLPGLLSHIPLPHGPFALLRKKGNARLRYTRVLSLSLYVVCDRVCLRSGVKLHGGYVGATEQYGDGQRMSRRGSDDETSANSGDQEKRRLEGDREWG